MKNIKKIANIPKEPCMLVLIDFIRYCGKHPEQRFWQALRNWSGVKYIYISNESSGEGELKDTFYWEGRNK